MTERVRSWEPVPQDLVQEDQAVQPETLQSMGQDCALQLRECLRPTQPMPPKAAELMTERVRSWTPVPQDLVQEDQVDQPETLQSTGQLWVLQTRSISDGHSSPPWAAAVFTLKTRVWTPVPQDLEQELQLAQPLTTQSTGQRWLLQ